MCQVTNPSQTSDFFCHSLLVAALASCTWILCKVRRQWCEHGDHYKVTEILHQESIPQEFLFVEWYLRWLRCLQWLASRNCLADGWHSPMILFAEGSWSCSKTIARTSTSKQLMQTAAWAAPLTHLPEEMPLPFQEQFVTWTRQAWIATIERRCSRSWADKWAEVTIFKPMCFWMSKYAEFGDYSKEAHKASVKLKRLKFRSLQVDHGEEYFLFRQCLLQVSTLMKALLHTTLNRQEATWRKLLSCTKRT